MKKNSMSSPTTAVRSRLVTKAVIAGHVEKSFT